mmetsp:Transcript_103514/g.231201  ORF Transcript_103514/g.231201 Transcript_103514/m.231201 type:complete len:340 (+) Transcript_103514:40-1059(+)
MMMLVFVFFLQGLGLCEAQVLHRRLRLNQPPPEGPTLPPGIFVTGCRKDLQRTDESHSYGYSAKEVSMEEANLTCSDISVYGAYVPKIPSTFVSQVAALKANSTKTSNYNFQGALERTEDITGPWRQWVIKFVKHHFSDDDVFVASDEFGKTNTWGPYDHTNDVEHYDVAQEKLEFPLTMDPTYYQTMIQSNFTLCPGGDLPWSMRFYEAILAGSIPVIAEEENDYSSSSKAFWFNQIGYKYFTVDQVVNLKASSAELKRIADDNYELFLKYQTWLDGDHVPPAYAAYSGNCLSDAACRDKCLNPIVNLNEVVDTDAECPVRMRLLRILSKRRHKNLWG